MDPARTKEGVTLQPLLVEALNQEEEKGPSAPVTLKGRFPSVMSAVSAVGGNVLDETGNREDMNWNGVRKDESTKIEKKERAILRKTAALSEAEGNQNTLKSVRDAEREASVEMEYSVLGEATAELRKMIIDSGELGAAHFQIDRGPRSLLPRRMADPYSLYVEPSLECEAWALRNSSESVPGLENVIQESVVTSGRRSLMPRVIVSSKPIDVRGKNVIWRSISFEEFLRRGSRDIVN